MEPYRALVIGAGYFGRQWLGVLRQRRDCRPLAMVAVDAESLRGALADAAATSLPGYASLAEALARETPDFAVVAVPEAVHRPVVCELIEHGIPLICEKPLAITREDAADIVAAQRRHPAVAVMIDQQFRWRPSIQTLRDLLGKGAIGRLGEVSIVHRQNITRGTVGGWRETMPQPYLFDMAVHFFDLVRYLSGEEAESVSARAYRPAWSSFTGAPALTATLELTGGVHAQVSGTFVGRGFDTAQEGAITLTGADGTLRYTEDRKLLRYRIGSASGEEVPLVEMTETDCAYTLTHFLGCLRDRTRPQTDLADNVRTFEIVLAALESDAMGCRVRVRAA